MRKTLSIILSVVMILSACCFALPVSAAPEGTPINTADEFLAMAADGTYYLNADITLTASYEAPFSGTLDGNGKTVTISAPMFKEFNGTAKNFTINGAITSEGLITVEEGYILGRMQIDTAKCTDYVVRITSIGTAIDEYGIFRAADEAAAVVIDRQLTARSSDV